MNKKNIVVTFLAAVLILAVGSSLPVLLDKVFFDADAVVEDRHFVGEQLEKSEESFLDGLLFPLKEETNPLSVEEWEYFQADSLALSADIYERMFTSAGISCGGYMREDAGRTEESNFVILQAEAGKENKKYRLHLAAKENIPVLFWLENAKAPSKEQMQEAAETLERYIGGQGEELKSYISQIDEIYGKSQGFQRMILRIYDQFYGGSQETAGEVSLWDCCSAGEWKVYTGGGQVILACVMGTESIVLYYDPAEGVFSGYNLAVNKSLLEELEP